MLNDYLHKDHLGSIMQITNQSGAVVENRSYDVWGSPRDPQTGKLLSNLKWLVGKDYTGHEHLPEFRLVNMQGRLYDPVLCRFLSPDPYVQEPDNSQSLNRYSYCFNNPLAYISEQSLNYLVELALKRGRNYIWYEGMFTTIRFEGWGGSPTTFGDYGCILRGLSNGTAVVNIFANYGYTYSGLDGIREAQRVFGRIPDGFINGITLSNKVVGYNVSVVNLGGGDLNIWGDISNSFLVGATANQPTYFRSSQIAKEGKFAVDGWKTYRNAFKGNQYVSSASVKEAKAAFNSIAKTTSRISTGLTLVSFGVTYANHAAGNVSDGRYYVQQTINAIGLFGPWGAGIAIGLGAVDAIWGDQIEGWIRE